MVLLDWKVSSGNRTKRKWQQLQGRNRLLCNGRIVMAQQMGIFLLTVFLIIVTMLMFFYFDGPFLYGNLGPVIPVTAAVLSMLVMGSLFRTSFSDPGIVPRATPTEALSIERELSADELNENGLSARVKSVLINGQLVRLKYCSTCKIFRPPRTSHCSICDNCIERFDHHCPWVGNCIGKRNYRYFYVFLLSLSLLCVFIFACVVVHAVLVTKEKGFVDFVLDCPGRLSLAQRVLLTCVQPTHFSLVVALICFFSIWSVLGLTGFHSYLITANQTTNEDIKGTFDGKREDGVSGQNPYAAGSFFRDCGSVLCAPQYPSLIDRRGQVSVGTHIDIHVTTVNDEVVSRIERGLCALVSVGRDDDARDVEYLANKILNLRLFEASDGKKWAESLSNLQLEVLCISQFTLHAFCKGNKLDFHLAKSPSEAQQMYADFLQHLRSRYEPELVKDGQFGAYMQVCIENDGPVTVVLDSKNR